MGVPFYIHNIDSSDKEKLIKVIDSGFLTTGLVVSEFEQNFAKYLGVKFVIGTSSWTSSAEVVLRYWGIKEGDEVIVPSLTYVATAQVVSRVGATPVFVDCDSETGLLDLELVAQAITKRTKAIIPVHLYGTMVDIKKLKKIIAGRNIKILEDAAHAIESSVSGIRPGSQSDAVCFSFYATKNITCGEGGAIATNDSVLDIYARKAVRAGTNKGVLTKSTQGFFVYDSEIIATKANMTNMQAALLVGQLDRIENLFKKRTEVYNYYVKKLSQVPEIVIPKIPKNCISALHLLVILVPNEKRTKLLRFLTKKEIGFGVHYPATHLLTLYKNKLTPNKVIGELNETIRWNESCITLPFYPRLSKKSIDEVVSVLSEFFRSNQI